MQENFSPQQSLQLIQSMIDKTKANMSENRFYFLLWGWVTFIAILGQFFLKVVLGYRHHYLVWLLTFVALFITLMRGRRQRAKKGVRTYIGESMVYLWTGMGISFFVLSFIISNSKEGWLQSYPFFILLYGLGTFVSGKILQFKPLIIGGIANWLLAAASIYFDFNYQMLFAAAAIFISYIIPGYLFKTIKENG